MRRKNIRKEQDLHFDYSPRAAVLQCFSSNARMVFGIHGR
jgi:hypothetical protein